MSKKNWRAWLLGAVTVSGIAAAFCVTPIPQDPTYHEFADRRTMFGLPNCWNVLSNLPFALVGAYGLSKLFRLRPASSRLAYFVFCSGVILVGVGSAYYHYAPSTQALVWDRLPMTVAFMALFSLVVSDRVSAQLGKGMLWPLILVGAASVGYWHWTEAQGRGDLRAYAVVQFLPMLLMPLMLLFFPGKTLRAPWLAGTLAAYALAKAAEHFDQAIYAATSFVSGHTLKHVLASLAVLFAVLAVLTVSDNAHKNRSSVGLA